MYPALQQKADRRFRLLYVPERPEPELFPEYWLHFFHFLATDEMLAKLAGSKTSPAVISP